MKALPMRLLIAEKPSVARSIAAVIGSSRTHDGFIETPDLVLTWGFGHLLSLEKPEDYKGGRLDMEDLPFVPASFRKSPRDKDSAKQLNIVTKLIQRADEIIHAGDPDREGQIIVDEILQHAGWTGPTRRLWLSAVDPTSIRKALDSLRNNADMADLSASAECRSLADWLVGMNGSIALSRKIQAAGGTEALSLGRVQTPTLALIVRRDHEINGFSKRHHYTVLAHIAGGIDARWKMSADLDGLSDDGLLLDKAVADQTASRITGKPARVVDCQVKQGSRAAPLPHCLSSLQKIASARFGMSAKATLAAAQSLYEGGFTTYPRTDCQYLPEEQLGAASTLLADLTSAGVTGAASADASLKHEAWSTSKVEAHHAIVPTGKAFSGDDAPAAKVYRLICEAFIRLFYPPEKFETREAAFDIDGLAFIAKSRTTISTGWTGIGADDDEDGDLDSRRHATAALPDLKHGETRTCEAGEVESKETKPPRRYTDGTLIAAMTRVHTLVDDTKLKARLKETSGLGTEATRAAIIENLLVRGYAERAGKDIRATDRGKALIAAVKNLYPAAADPGVTAIWEDALSAVAAGKISASDFMEAQTKHVHKLVDAIRDAPAISGMGPAASKFDCPACKASKLVERKTKKGFKFFSCSSESCKAAFFKEKDGKPGARLGEPGESGGAREGTGPACPDCKKLTLTLKTKTGKPYLRCATHGAWWPSADGKSLGKKWPDR